MKTLTNFLVGSALILIALALLSLSGDVLYWLHQGVWVGRSVAQRLMDLNLTHFDEWLGIFRILHAIPDWIGLFVLGIFSFFLALCVKEPSSRPSRSALDELKLKNAVSNS